MKILHINTTDTIGGAARAAYRLHCGLNEMNCESLMWVQAKQSDDYRVLGPKNKIQRIIAKISPTLDDLFLIRYKKRLRVGFTPAYIGSGLKKVVEEISPDLIHLHWIAGGFIRIEELKKLKKPIIWTLHDMWPFTGGCHYVNKCGLYKSRCMACPQLNSKQKKDLSTRIQSRKLKSWKNININVVTPSKWLAECASQSEVFKNRSIKVIPNGINTKEYRGIDKEKARDLLLLPKDKKLILFAAMSPKSDKRKGYDLLKQALNKIESNSIELMIMGASRPKKEDFLKYSINYMGQLNDDISLALLYSSADVFVAPSIQENLANTVVESLVCGTPCVAYDVGGMPDMIIHKQNGYLAKPFDINDLMEGIVWVLEDENRYNKISINARLKAKKDYDINHIAGKYKKLYEEILNQ